MELPVMRLYVYVIFALVIALLAILFALQNTNLVTIQFFLWEYRQSLAVVLLGTLGIGVLVGFLFSAPAIIRREFKASRIQKQADALTALVQEKEQSIHTESYKMQAVRQSHEELLRSIGITEPTTGFLRGDLLPQTIAAQLKQVQAQSTIAKLPSLSVLMFKVKPALASELPPEKVFATIAQRLQEKASPNTWFYSDGQGLFSATLVGLDLKELTHYGEDLQAALLENPPLLPSGQAIGMDIAVGGAIADTQTAMDGHHLVSTAETALNQALQRGRNRVRILQAS